MSRKYSYKGTIDNKSGKWNLLDPIYYFEDETFEPVEPYLFFIRKGKYHCFIIEEDSKDKIAGAFFLHDDYAYNFDKQMLQTFFTGDFLENIQRNFSSSGVFLLVEDIPYFTEAEYKDLFAYFEDEEYSIGKLKEKGPFFWWIESSEETTISSMLAKNSEGESIGLFLFSDQVAVKNNITKDMIKKAIEKKIISIKQDGEYLRADFGDNPVFFGNSEEFSDYPEVETDLLVEEIFEALEAFKEIEETDISRYLYNEIYEFLSENLFSNAKLFVFEGGECSGKTTIITKVKEELEKEGKEVIVFREPGGCKTSEAIRKTIMENPMSKLTEAYLFAAARAEFVETKLLPALQKDNVIILLDRFFYSSLVYQGIVGEVGFDTVYELNKKFIEEVNPTAWFFLDVETQTQMKRMEQRGILNRLDERSEKELENIKNGYRSLVKKMSGIQINGNEAPELVVEKIIEEILEFCES